MITGVDSAPERPWLNNCARWPGISATMPTKMISEMPLPMPRAVICSPSHIRNMVPPTSVITTLSLEEQARIMGQTARSRTDGQTPGLEQRQRHGAVAGVLVDLLAALLALFLQLFQRRHHRGQQLHDDRGRDIGHDAKREDPHPAKRAAGEHGQDAADAGFERLFHEVAQRCAVDAGDRDIGAKAVDDQQSEREPDALTKVGGLAEGPPRGSRPSVLRLTPFKSLS
jgi:hypothetical protein